MYYYSYGLHHAANYYPYVYHSGVQGMQWYKHLFGAQQALSKYAKGADTYGVILKNQAKRLKKESRDELRRANRNEGFLGLFPLSEKGREKLFVSSANKKQEAKEKNKKSKSYIRKGRTAAILSGVLGASLWTVDKVYGAGESIAKALGKLGHIKIKSKTINKLANSFNKFLTTKSEKVYNKTKSMNENLYDEMIENMDKKQVDKLDMLLDEIDTNDNKKKGN